MWSLDEETEKALANLTAVYERYEEAVKQMLDQDKKRWTRRVRAVEFAVRSMVKVRGKSQICASLTSADLSLVINWRHGPLGQGTMLRRNWRVSRLGSGMVVEMEGKEAGDGGREDASSLKNKGKGEEGGKGSGSTEDEGRRRLDGKVRTWVQGMAKGIGRGGGRRWR